MAVPDRTPQQMVATLHNAPVGFSQQGFTLQSRTPIGDTRYESCVVKKGPRTWDVHYGVPLDGTPGKVISVIDDQGRVWFQTDGGQSWVNDLGETG